MSIVSVPSIGIGASSVQLIPKTDIARLRPEDGISDYIRVYDCVVYLMYCSKHEKMALTNTKQNKYIWLPFVLLSDNETWEQIARQGVALMIGKKDAETEAKFSKIPNLEINPLHFLRIQLTDRRFFIRYTNFVNIEEIEDFHCCQETESLAWVPVSDILQLENTWGPEILEFTNMLINHKFLIREITSEDVLAIQNEEVHAKLLNDCNITSEIILAVYDEFIESCYPSTYMCFDAFKAFLIRFGYMKNDTRFPWIFNAMSCNKKEASHYNSFLDFNEFLIGLLCMEPNSDNDNSYRLAMIYRYYNVQNNSDMSLREFIALIQELYPNETENRRIRKMVDDIGKKLNQKFDEQTRITFLTFETIVRHKYLKGIGGIFRSPKSIIQQIYANHKNALKGKNLKSEIKSTSTSEPTSKPDHIRGCRKCVRQKYEYALHCVCFDSEGYCVKPLRLYDVRIDEMTPLRYSAEFVFGMNTICRNFLDLVRVTAGKGDGLFIGPEDHANAFRTIKSLCDFVQNILICEDRLLKIHAPTLVIGNLCGRIESIMSLESTFWKSVPVLTTNILFLGNYSGLATGFNVEVICYILALKIASPNKVFLLRGFNETVDTSSELLDECTQKYGTDKGKNIWLQFQKVFARLPIAALIDESIICVHSGIPKSDDSIIKFSQIPVVLQNVCKESPLAYEIISSIPNALDRSSSGKVNRGSNVSGRTSSDEFPRIQEYMFNAFYNFMTSNHLQYMIRARETPTPDGYKLYFDSRCITITSALPGFSVVANIESGYETIRLNKIIHSFKTKDTKHGDKEARLDMPIHSVIN